MANSINPFAHLNNRDTNSFDRMAERIKQRMAEIKDPSAAAPEDAASEEAPKTRADQLKDIFERGGLGQLFDKSRGYGPANPLAAGGLPKGDLFSPLEGGFDKMLGAMGLDPAKFGVEGADAMQYTRVQYELNISVMQTMMNGNEQITQGMNFSFKLDYQWLSLGKAGQTASNPFGVESSDDANAVMEKLKEYFNPENTAGRILDFALGFYPNSKWAKTGDTEANRQGFSDYIGSAIQKGFDQAMGILGKVDEKTQAGVDETHDRVFKGLEDFVKNGLTEQQQQQAGGVEAWRMSMEMSYTQYYSRTTYAAPAVPAATAAPESGTTTDVDPTAVDPATASSDTQA